MLQVDKYTIKWKHERYEDNSKKMDGSKVLSDYQAITTCILAQEDSLMRRVGFAWCVWGDNFSHDIGRRLSLKDALGNSHLNKEEKRLIWEGYRDMAKEPRW